MKEQTKCYLVCNAKDDLPVAVLDSPKEIMQYFDCCRSTVYNMINDHRIINGLYVEVVLL